MFLIRHPLVLRFVKTTYFFANGEGVLFSTDMKHEISFGASSHDHDPDWRSRRGHDSNNEVMGSKPTLVIFFHSFVLFPLCAYILPISLFEVCERLKHIRI